MTHEHAYAHTGTLKVFQCYCGHGFSEVAISPAGEGIAGLPTTATSSAAPARAERAPEHDPRCISLTDSDFNSHCDCETLRLIDRSPNQEVDDRAN